MYDPITTQDKCTMYKHIPGHKCALPMSHQHTILGCIVHCRTLHLSMYIHNYTYNETKYIMIYDNAHKNVTNLNGVFKTKQFNKR